jgi:hypothetical protein
MLKLHMGLTAMVHLVLEQMRQQVADGLGRRSLAPLGFDAAVQIGVCQSRAERSSRASEAACAAPSFAASRTSVRS